MTDTLVRLELPWVLQAGYEPVARRLLQTYLGRQGFTGACFETLGRRWDDPDHLYILDAVDILAVSTLGEQVPARASIAILGLDADRISGLLALLDPALPLMDAPDDLMLADGSPGQELWTILTGHDDVGPGTASKLLARKRPHLYPIYDPVLRRELRLVNSGGFWRGMREAMRENDRELYRRVERLVDDVAPGSSLTPMRASTIVMWMHGKDHGRSELIASGAGLRVPRQFSP